MSLLPDEPAEPGTAIASEAMFVSEARPALEKQFERIVAEYGPAISRLACSYEAVAGVREELVQDIALAIWQALPHFRGDCSERTFIYRIAHNRGLTHACRRRPGHQSLDDLEPSEEPADPRLEPDEQVARMHQRDQLMSAIQALPMVHRQVIVLTLEGLSPAEIGEV
ncbi:MAG TPA: RNA polymerase sigma factor, partial [Candidatus Limnocylindrales bacterium]|nr:RNA polymerase sigma factor [Candidatus Limnocylindrales bacterium]